VQHTKAGTAAEGERQAQISQDKSALGNNKKQNRNLLLFPPLGDDQSIK
jgi:hypothetical protein